MSLAAMDPRTSAALESMSHSINRPSLARPLKKLYRGEPMALGITQILIGIMETAFGLVLVMAQRYNYGGHGTTPYWLAFLYIISGSLSVAVAKNPKVPLVKGMLGMNIVSAVAAGIGTTVLLFSVVQARQYDPCYYHQDELSPEICHELKFSDDVMHHVWVILLVFSILEFVIAITTAGFGCASLCRDSYSETTVVIFQNTPGPEGPAVLPMNTKEHEVP